MNAVHDRDSHQEVWLLLPWAANGRLASAERERVEEHLRHCDECRQELSAQQLLQGAINEPDRIVYAPGPSFRKLMARIDGDGKPQTQPRRKEVHSVFSRLGHVSLWRPPGLAWAASFLILFGVTGLMFAAYQWSRPDFRTATDSPAGTPNVLHIALDRSLRIGEVEELLRDGGARIVEGPGNTGILGVVPAGVVPGQTPASSAQKQQRALSARLRTDPRVLWVQPLPDEDAPADRRTPGAREH